MRRGELRTLLRELQREQVGDPAGLHDLPDWPRRFPLRLSSVDQKLMGHYMDLSELPALKLTSDYELVWPGRGMLGRFATKELTVLKRLGEWVRLYTPRVLEISPSGWVAIELVRPDLTVCKRCHRVYPEGSTQCERCKAPLTDETGAAAHVDFTQLRDDLREDDASR